MLGLSGAYEERGASNGAFVNELPDEAGERPPAGRLDLRALAVQLKVFGSARPVRSGIELAVTLVPFAALCGLMLVAVGAGYYAALALTVPTGLFLLRLFLIQHDCGHGSFLRSR